MQKENLINVPEKYYPAAAGIGYLVGTIRKEKPMLPTEVLLEGAKLEKLFESIETFKGMNPGLDKALVEYKAAREEYNRFIVNFTAEAILDKKQSLEVGQENASETSEKNNTAMQKKQDCKEFAYV